MAEKDKKKRYDDPMFKLYLAQLGVSGNLSEDELAAIYDDYAGKREKIQNQQRYVDALSTTEVPQGRQVGGIFRASNPLEMLGMAAQRGVGAMGQRKLDAQRDALNEQSAKARSSYARALAQAVAGGDQQPPVTTGDASNAAQTPATQPPAPQPAPTAQVGGTMPPPLPPARGGGYTYGQGPMRAQPAVQDTPNFVMESLQMAKNAASPAGPPGPATQQQAQAAWLMLSPEERKKRMAWRGY